MLVDSSSLGQFFFVLWMIMATETVNRLSFWVTSPRSLKMSEFHYPKARNDYFFPAPPFPNSEEGRPLRDLLGCPGSEIFPPLNGSFKTYAQ